MVDKTPTVGRHSPNIRPDFHGPDPGPPSQTMESHQGDDSTLPKKRLLLLGKTGAGKSASGNTILGEDVFHSELSFNAVTTQLKVQQAAVAGRLVSVIDTRGLLDTERRQEDVFKELEGSIYDCCPGPHALLIVLSLAARLTPEEKRVTDLIKACYGEDALNYTIILFTYGDQLKGKDVKKIIEDNNDLSGLVSGCGGRYHVFNNEDKTNRCQVTELLDMIDVMVDQNGGGYYSNTMLQDEMRRRAEEEQKREKEKKEKESLEKQQRLEEIERAKREVEERNKWKWVVAGVTGGVGGVVLTGGVALAGGPAAAAGAVGRAVAAIAPVALQMKIF